MNITSIGWCPTLEELASHMLSKKIVCLSVQVHEFAATITCIERESEESDFFLFRGTCRNTHNPDAPVQSVVGRLQPGSHICNIQIKHVDVPAFQKSA